MTLSLRATLLLVLLSLPLFLRCGTKQENEVIRLIELVGTADAQTPDFERSAWPKGIMPAGVVEGIATHCVVRFLMNGPPSAARTSHRQYGDDSRLALLSPASGRYRFEIDLPAEPVLNIGLGYPPPQTVGSRIRYQIRISDKKESSVLLDQSIATARDGAWQMHALSLDAWSGGRVALELVTEAEGNSKGWAAWSSPEITSRADEEEGWNVVLVMLDTLRADRLGAYGYNRPTSPNLDALAQRSVRFANVVSQSPWTRPSHRALFTGLYPASTQGLESFPLASLLWKAGYRTTALTAGGYIHSKFGFDAGFDSYRVHDWLVDLDAVTKALAPRRKQFLFLHTYEIHDPYTHDELTKGIPSGRVRPGFAGRVYREIKPLSEEEILYTNALYDSGVAFTDRRLGELFRLWERLGVFDSSIIIVTSDHGEELWDHGGFRHGKTLYDDQLMVPLILWLPSELRARFKGYTAGRVINGQVRLIDLYPTVIDLLGLALQHEVQGRSLAPMLEGQELPELDAFSEATITAVQLVSLRSPRYKFIQTVEGEAPLLFNLELDDAETHNLAETSPDLLNLLRQRIRSIRSGERRPEDVLNPEDLDPELLEQLKALGYIQ